MASLLALAAAVCWGTADFVGGLAARRVSALAVALVAQATGALLLFTIALLSGIAPPPSDLVAVGLATGLVGGIAFWGIYASLALGSMARVAPVFATAPAIPVMVGLLSGDELSWSQCVGIGGAGIGIALVSSEPPTEDGEEGQGPHSRRAFGLALVTAAAIGVAMIGVDRVAESSALWAVLLPRATAVAVLAGVALATTGTAKGAGMDRRVLLALAAIGVLDTGANMLWASASTYGELSLTAMLGAVFPAVTVILSLAVLGERLSTAQALGIALTLAGSALIVTG